MTKSALLWLHMLLRKIDSMDYIQKYRFLRLFCFFSEFWSRGETRDHCSILYKQARRVTRTDDLMFCLDKVDQKCRLIAKKFRSEGWRISWPTRSLHTEGPDEKEIYVFFEVFRLWSLSTLRKRVFILLLRRLPSVLISLILKFCACNWFCDFGFFYSFNVYEFSCSSRHYPFYYEWDVKVELFNLFLTDLKGVLANQRKTVWFPVSSISITDNSITIWNHKINAHQVIQNVVRWPKHFFPAWNILFPKENLGTDTLWSYLSHARLLFEPSVKILILESDWMLFVSDKGRLVKVNNQWGNQLGACPLRDFN